MYAPASIDLNRIGHSREAACISSQFNPDRTSTMVGTLSMKAFSMTSFTTSAACARADSETSRTSSSCTWRMMRRRKPFRGDPLVEVDHGLLDDVGLGALDRHVHRHALGALASRAVRRGQVRQVAAATPDGADIAVHESLLDHPSKNSLTFGRRSQ